MDQVPHESKTPQEKQKAEVGKNLIHVTAPTIQELTSHGYMKPPETPMVSLHTNLLRSATDILTSFARKGNKPDPYLEGMKIQQEAQRRAEAEMQSIGAVSIAAHEYIAPILLNRAQVDLVRRSYGEDANDLFNNAAASAEVLAANMQDTPDTPLAPSVIKMRDHFIQLFTDRTIPWKTNAVQVRLHGETDRLKEIVDVSITQESGTEDRTIHYRVDKNSEGIDAVPVPHQEMNDENVAFYTDPPRFIIGKLNDSDTFTAIGSLDKVRFLATAANKKPTEVLKDMGYNDIRQVVATRPDDFAPSRAK